MNALNFTIDFKNKVNINEKFSELTAALASIKFENKVAMPNFMLFTKDDTHIIIITETQYTYKIESEFNNALLPTISENILKTTNSIIEWVTDSNYYIRYVSIKDCPDAFQKTKQKCGIINDDDSILGVGYRYLISKTDRLSEFKAEPLIRDANKLFFEAIYNFKQFHCNMNLSETFNTLLLDFENRITRFEQEI